MDAPEKNTQDGHKVKRVSLPSGKTIEVVYFEPVAQPLPRSRRARRTRQRPPRLPRVRLEARLPDPLERGRPGQLGSHAALPQLRMGPHRRLRPGHRRDLRRGARPRHRRPGRRPQAPDPREHGRRDRALLHRVGQRPHPARRLLSRGQRKTFRPRPVGLQGYFKGLSLNCTVPPSSHAFGTGKNPVRP